MVENINKQLDKLSLTKEDTLVVAVSGGPDSMFLLWVLLQYQRKISYQLVCAHVNHNVREESSEEEQFVKQFCLENHVSFECLSVKEWDQTNFHEQAHHKRYAFFEKLIEKYQANYLCTAHHGDDLIETILMHIVRGSTLKGYRGFKSVENRGNYTLLRPLLEYTKDEILDFVIKENIPYVIDNSNTKDKYTRNRYRKYIVPALKQEEKNLVSKFRSFSETLCLYEDSVEEEFQKLLPKVIESQTIDLNQFHTCSYLLQKKFIYYILEQRYQKDLSRINKHHVDLIFQLIHSKKPNASIELPGKILVRKKYHQLFFEHKNFTSEDYDIEINGDVILPNGKTILCLEEPEDFSNFSCCLDSSEIRLPLHVRNRQMGDVIEVKGLHGHKKIKDIFIDCKIDIDDRKTWPIVTDDQGIVVWIPGLKKSKFDKTKEQKYDIILKYR